MFTFHPLHPLTKAEMKVTALKVQSRNQSRVNVYLDGKFAFGLAKIEAARLRVGQELDEAAIARLKKADEVEQAHERALKLLAVRPRSEAEIRRRLREHEVPEPVMAEVFARLRRAGLADDGAFASYWVENRATFRPRSKRALTVELKRKGVTGETLDQALAEVDDAEAAYRAAAQRARRLGGLPYPEFRRKLGEFLGRRGFDYETIEPTVERVWKETRSREIED
jgi:regulatory protein